ncbi:TSUP family transporter [Bowmanella sp. JS7-9]|uniref:Probable membrane transporter protein n=1 Tax=Pseudobowmanella zhangzhouensis TaxID=1537679 RepID=A0ABW1XJC0_9ALTE|nr:TSUP family transporter [Bowmanella sp. JS7-9]TBX24580.1 hypothetical protein TK45_04740 [Bowmanella sp. JS7-9]
MLEVTPQLVLYLSLLAVVAGFIDSIGGGGGLISIPVLIMAGLTPAQALATNKLQAIFGKISAVRFFTRHGLIQLSGVKLPLLLCFMASAFGAYLIQQIPSQHLQSIVPWLIAGVALYVLFSPRLTDMDTQQRISLGLYGLIIVPLLAFYDGFFGPASGSFFAISLIALLGFHTAKATAYAKLFLLVSNAAALGAFILGGQVVWSIGLGMACGQWVGARYGSELVYLKGSKIVKPALVLVSLTLVTKMLLIG